MFFLLACLGDPGRVRAEDAVSRPRKIGLIAALTGPTAWWGQSIARLAEYARKDAEGGEAVTVVVEDDAFSPKQAVAAAEKLIDQDHVSAILTFGGGSSTAVAAVCERRKVPMLGISVTDSYVRGRHFVSRIFMSNDSQTQVFLDTIRARGFTKIAVATLAQESMLAARQAFREKNSANIVADEEFLPDQTDMKSAATKLLAKNPDALVLFINPPLVSTLTRALREQGFTGTFLGGVGVYSPGNVEASANALIGTIFPSPDRRRAASILERYEAEFHDLPASDSLFAYDALTLLVKAMKSKDAATWLTELDTFDGIAGRYTNRDHSLSVEGAAWKIAGAKSIEPL